MTTKEFLTENREMVIEFYNKEIKDYWNISLGKFMLDVMSNFKKATKKEIKGYTMTDLKINLLDAKSRLGMFDKVEVVVKYSKPYSESNHAKAVAYHGKEKVQLMSNAK